MKDKPSHLEQALAILNEMDDGVAERGGGGGKRGSREITKVQRAKDHLLKAAGAPRRMSSFVGMIARMTTYGTNDGWEADDAIDTMNRLITDARRLRKRTR